MDQIPGIIGDWMTILVPVMAFWAGISVQIYRHSEHRSLVDAFFFVVLLAVSTITLRTICQSEPWWLVHTASLGVMVVAGVAPRREAGEEAAHFIAS